MNWWDAAAGQLQAMGRHDYPAEEGSKEDTYRIVLHTRQDVILIVSYLSSLNKQMMHAKLLLFAVVILLTIIAFRH